MTAREDLLYEMTHNHLYMDDDQANAKIDAFAHELAERIVNIAERKVGVGPYSLGIMSVLNESIEEVFDA